MQPLHVHASSPLLDFLLERLATLKRTKVKQLLKFGSVRVNGGVVTSHRHALKSGDTVDFLDKKTAAAEREKKASKLDIVYEDEDVLVVNKPAGLLTIATEREKERTLYFALTAYASRIFVVHRLDRDTSGLVVFAKNLKAKLRLQENWTRAVKHYQAVVEGKPEEDNGEIRSKLAEDKFRRVYKTGKTGAKESVTYYRVAATNGRYSLLELNLKTGRKNQIRVHLADLGHPVAGDFKYGAKSDPLGRMALHASRLSFPHPSTGKTMSFDCPPPTKFEALIKPSKA